ncbi:alpha-1-acid glycoprotein 1-like [Sebastes umbrosus]|uniref:alpha-1-acid glycoprotein 1-like n=1 Tax=Sebastes umbrosus TaxID=72105 RepID=UPI00189E50BF|nr:alpha-1-acid glycoprotein 1-like [Sebastes umbrosus]
MFAVGAITLLCMVCVSHSAPLACEDLVRPLDHLDPRHLEGRWVLVAGSLSHLPFMERLRRRDSATATFSSNTSETNIALSRSMRLDDKCHYHFPNISLEGNSFTFDDGNVTTTFIHTSCRDCILMSFDVESGKRQHFYLYSRRRELEQKEMEEFRAQVECLNMPPPAVMDPSKELCPEETAGDPAAQTEEKTEGQKD